MPFEDRLKDIKEKGPKRLLYTALGALALGGLFGVYELGTHTIGPSKEDLKLAGNHSDQPAHALAARLVNTPR